MQRGVQAGSLYDLAPICRLSTASMQCIVQNNHPAIAISLRRAI
jgi:hypothetical protein